MRIDELILYRHFKNGEILQNMALLTEGAGKADDNLYYEVVHGLIELAGSHGYSGKKTYSHTDKSGAGSNRCRRCLSQHISHKEEVHGIV